MKKLFGNIYNGRKVFITGHTGFKGSWLYLWLEKLNAIVKGYSIAFPTQPSHFSLLYPGYKSEKDDVRDLNNLMKCIDSFKPEIIFHLAAQPLVRFSYDYPVDTYETNIMGTVNILEAARKCKSVKAVVVVTSDKCYENKEWIWGYRENDRLGGYDPYSSSKGCAELIVSAYRNSFFYDNKNCLIASVRAGNVIGGGDWASDRLIPDIIKASVQNEKAEIRNPDAVRPWQHVLEPLCGYLQIGQKLLEGVNEFASAWNFGPDESGIISVNDLLAKTKKYWNTLDFDIKKQDLFHETRLLKLDCSKAKTYLAWRNIWKIDHTIRKTIEWYKNFYERKIILTNDHLDEYISDANKMPDQ